MPINDGGCVSSKELYNGIFLDCSRDTRVILLSHCKILLLNKNTCKNSNEHQALQIAIKFFFVQLSAFNSCVIVLMLTVQWQIIFVWVMLQIWIVGTKEGLIACPFYTFLILKKRIERDIRLVA